MQISPIPSEYNLTRKFENPEVTSKTTQHHRLTDKAMAHLKDRLKPDSTYKVAYGDDLDSLENPRYIIAYWSIRGLASPLRMMLTAAQVNHWVIFYDVKEIPDGKWSKDSYLHDKSWLKEEYNPLMNLPFLVDCANDTVISQTNAIFTFLGRELNMLGSNSQDQTICEELLCEVMDIRKKNGEICLCPKHI